MGLLKLTLATLLGFGVAASCSGATDDDVSDSFGGDAGELGGAASPGAAGRREASGGSGGGASSLGGMESLAGTDSSDGTGGIDSMGGGSGGAADEGPRPFPGHAGTICDPTVTYPAPLPSPASRTATRLSESYFFTEGPVWIASGGYLLFTDMYNVGVPPYLPGAHIRRFTPPNTFDTFITDTDTNGLALSADGLVLLAARRSKASANDGEIASYVISSKQKATVLDNPMNPNDVAVRSDDNVYFSDGDVYRIDPNGDVSTAAHVASETANGVMLSPDETTLYTGWSSGAVYASALGTVGTAGAAVPFAALQDGGHPDGMTVDCAGSLYVADYSNGTVQAFDSRGTYLGKITLPAASGSSAVAEHATNVAFGGPDHRTLFITGHRGDWNDPAVGELHSIVLNVPGLPY